jgi:hypothetical protein
MPTSTTNYGLIKPGTDDPILIGQINDNMDTIDTVLKDHSDKIDAAALGIKYKGEVNYYADLPNNAEIGDAYTVKYAGSSGTTPDGTEYVWGTVSGTNQWINFSKDSYTKAEVDALLALKQNALNSAQLAAVNSGIDSAKVAQIDTNKNNILSNTLNGGGINKFQVTATTTTINGITFTVNADKTITATGSIADSTQGNAIFTLGAYTAVSGDVLSEGLGEANSKAYIYARGGSTSLAYVTYNKILAGDIGVQRSYACVITSGTVGQVNITFKPMICNSDSYAKSGVYQPYAMSNAELTAAIQALQAQLANQ